MSGYCEHKKQYSSHSYDITLNTPKGTKKQFYIEFKSRTNKDKLAPSQFYIYVCDCLGDLKRSNKHFKATVTSHVVGERMNKYLYSPSFNLLAKKVLPTGLFCYVSLLIFVLMVTKDKINILNNKDYPYLFLLSAIGMQVVALLFIWLHTFIFRFNGKGFWIFDMFGHCWLMAGDSCCFFLIILLARGWGTKFINFPQGFVNKLFAVGSMIIFRYIWTIYSWYNMGSSEHGETHIFDGVPGFLEIAIGLTKFSVYLVVWWGGYLKSGPSRGLEVKHWRRLDNLLFIAAFIAVVVRAICIMSIERFESAYHESVGLIIAMSCNFTMMVILSILMAPTNSPYMKLAKSKDNGLGVE